MALNLACGMVYGYIFWILRYCGWSQVKDHSLSRMRIQRRKFLTDVRVTTLKFEIRLDEFNQNKTLDYYKVPLVLGKQKKTKKINSNGILKCKMLDNGCAYAQDPNKKNILLDYCWGK